MYNSVCQKSDGQEVGPSLVFLILFPPATKAISVFVGWMSKALNRKISCSPKASQEFPASVDRSTIEAPKEL
jgi:hypothetical protein